MQLLEQRILAEGEVKSSEILKVDRFLNHQMDIAFLQIISAPTCCYIMPAAANRSVVHLNQCV